MRRWECEVISSHARLYDSRTRSGSVQRGGGKVERHELQTRNGFVQAASLRVAPLRRTSWQPQRTPRKAAASFRKGKVYWIRQTPDSTLYLNMLTQSKSRVVWRQLVQGRDLRIAALLLALVARIGAASEPLGLVGRLTAIRRLLCGDASQSHDAARHREGGGEGEGKQASDKNPRFEVWHGVLAPCSKHTGPRLGQCRLTLVGEGTGSTRYGGNSGGRLPQNTLDARHGRKRRPMLRVRTGSSVQRVTTLRSLAKPCAHDSERSA